MKNCMRCHKDETVDWVEKYYEGILSCEDCTKDLQEESYKIEHELLNSIALYKTEENTDKCRACDSPESIVCFFGKLSLHLCRECYKDIPRQIRKIHNDLFYKYFGKQLERLSEKTPKGDAIV